MISGARYHLVATYSVMKPVSPPFGSAVVTLLASPKSHTLRSQFAFSNRFEGFRSRWMTSAECSALSARSVLPDGRAGQISTLPISRTGPAALHVLIDEVLHAVTRTDSRPRVRSRMVDALTRRKKSALVIGQSLCLDDSIQICLHQFLDQVDLRVLKC